MRLAHLVTVAAFIGAAAAARGDVSGPNLHGVFLTRYAEARPYITSLAILLGLG